MRLRVKSFILAMSFTSVLLISGVTFAASNSDFSQTINAGTLSTDILDSVRAAVASPSVAMSAKNFSFDCQAGGGGSTGTFGSNTERIYVNNPNGANNGWTLTIAATSGATSTWENAGSTSFIDFNDPTGATAGCSDGADADSSAGQMTIDPNAGTLTADCATCTTTNVSKGSSSSFNQGTTDNITILNAAASSDDIWRGYLTGATVNQTIPAETAADTFTINLTLTATAS
jgi:hypothetical protein